MWQKSIRSANKKRTFYNIDIVLYFHLLYNIQVPTYSPLEKGGAI